MHAPSVERRSVAGPSLPREPQRVLEERVALAEIGERDAERVGLAFEPGRTDTEIGAPAREHVDGGRGLDQHGGRPVDHAGDEHAEADPLRRPGEIAECGIRLEHWMVFGFAPRRDLEVVIHDPERVEPRLFGGARDLLEPARDLRRATGPRERDELKADLHVPRNERTRARIPAGSSPCAALCSCHFP